jgi:hypothetical protein
MAGVLVQLDHNAVVNGLKGVYLIMTHFWSQLSNGVEAWCWLAWQDRGSRQFTLQWQ